MLQTAPHLAAKDAANILISVSPKTNVVSVFQPDSQHKESFERKKELGLAISALQNYQKLLFLAFVVNRYLWFTTLLCR